MAMDYNDWPREEDTMSDENIQDETYEEPPLDENVLTPEQKVELDKLCTENTMLTRSDLAIMIRLNIMSHRAALEGRELTFYEIGIAQALEEVIYWVPPCPLEGTCDSTVETHDYEDSHIPCIDVVASSVYTPILIDECHDLICETHRLDTLRVEKLTRDYHEICFDINHLSALNAHDLEFKFPVLEESKSILEKSYLGDVLDVDKILNEAEGSKVEIDFREEDIVFYMIDGDEVDYFVMNSFKPEVDFIFPSNAFDPHEHLSIKENFKLYAIIVVELFDVKLASLAWIVGCCLAHVVFCNNRRRTKDALAQPFDSYD
uniref:Uncharacterized protein n=1 Tax=Noccaea caerulescens TaxID=107243 RepID=A0A1J3EAI5_NOCCA